MIYALFGARLICRNFKGWERWASRGVSNATVSGSFKWSAVALYQERGLCGMHDCQDFNESILLGLNAEGTFPQSQQKLQVKYPHRSEAPNLLA